MREAVDFLREEPFLGKMQLVGPLMGAVIVPIPALVFPAWFVFGHQDSRALGIFLGAGAIGGMAGGIVFSAYGEKLAQRTWLVGATALYAAAILSLYFVQPGSAMAIAVNVVAGLNLSVLFAVPFTAFYGRTPQELLGRVGSLGAAQGSLMGAAASLGIGWLMHTVSAPTALLVCASMMGAIAVALATMPFMRLLDAPVEEPEAETEDDDLPELACAA